MKDASQNALIAQKLLADKQSVEEELDQKYEILRAEYQQEQSQIVSLEEARKNKLRYEE
jgi:5-methyltetrahydrofolate--homocysteine methyltransferase